MAKYQVVGFGALNWDDIRQVDEIVGPGGESSGTVLKGSPGGSAANTTVGLSRLGGDTAFVGAVGNDETGRHIIETLENESVEPLVVVKEGHTGNCTILVDRKGERSIFVFPEVNDTISLKEMPGSTLKAIEEADYFYSSTFACTRSFESLMTQLELSKRVKRFVFSPGTLYTDPGSIVVRNKKEVINALFENTDILFLNHEEIRMLTGQNNCSSAAKKLMEEHRKISTIAVTIGEKGCYVAADGDEVTVPSFRPEKIMDTVGAGDSFAAGFMFGLINGKNPKTCGEIGNYVASKVIGKTGARDGLPSLNDPRIREFMQRGP